MALGAQLPVRLDSEVEERLQSIAEKTGSSKSALIRLLAKTFTDHIFDSGGRISLPPDWQSLLKSADGRSKSNSVKAKVVQGVAKEVKHTFRRKSSAV
jgi:Ribbon-helix-helix protein, copG family